MNAPAPARLPASPDRESELVQLVDATGETVGEMSVAQAHQAPGHRHRAFSVYLVDGTGRVLLQRRAATKTRFALRWANAACGHPRPGETVLAAATRRLGEELGLGGVDLTEIGVYSYRAEDGTTGRVEEEYDHVLLGLVDPTTHRPSPDPAEVVAVQWVPAGDLVRRMRKKPDDFAPWLAGVTDLALAVDR